MRKMEYETLKVINSKIRDLIKAGSISEFNMAIDLITAINNPLNLRVKRIIKTIYLIL